MSQTEPEHVNHPLTDLAIFCGRTAHKTARLGLKGLSLLNKGFHKTCEGLGYVETGIESAFREPLDKLSKLAKSKPVDFSALNEKSASKLNDFQHELVRPGKEKIIGRWLMGVATMVFLMICLGAYTRLLKMGHSLTGMHATSWKGAYDSFKGYVDHILWRKHETGFTLLFGHEYLSTMLERVIGTVYLVPLFYFLFRGYIRPKLRNRLLALIAMQILQGFIGSWLSNFETRHRPGVVHGKILMSPYRMVLHWGTTMLMFGVIMWNSMTLLRSPKEKGIYGGYKDMAKMGNKMRINLLINVANFMTGVVVASIDGSREFNTFPLMDGKIIPEGYLHEKSFLRDLFENVATAQFHHRFFAFGTYFMALYLYLASRNMNLTQSAKRGILSLFIIANLQLVDGILVLLTKGYWLVGLFHQANAIWILTSTLFTLHALTFPMSFSLEQGQRQSESAPKESFQNPSESDLKKKSSMKSDEQRQQEADITGGSTEPARETTKKIEGAEQEIARSKEDLDQPEKKFGGNVNLGGEPVQETTK